MNIKEKRATFKLMLWTLAWAISVALATFAPRYFLAGNKFLSVLVLVINIGVGVGMILANRGFLNSTDELQRKIQLEAMAVTLGSGLVGGIAYKIMDKIDLIPFDAEISNLIMFMAAVYMVSIIIGKIRYL